MTEFSEESCNYPLINTKPWIDIRVKREGWTLLCFPTWTSFPAVSSGLWEEQIPDAWSELSALTIITRGNLCRKYFHKRLLFYMVRKRSYLLSLIVINFKVIAGCTVFWVLVVGSLHLDHRSSLSTKHPILSFFLCIFTLSPNLSVPSTLQSSFLTFSLPVARWVC